MLTYRKKLSDPVEKDILDLSTNVAYGEVRAKERSRAKEDYENVEVVLQSPNQFTELKMQIKQEPSGALNLAENQKYVDSYT